MDLLARHKVVGRSYIVVMGNFGYLRVGYACEEGLGVYLLLMLLACEWLLMMQLELLVQLRV